MQPLLPLINGTNVFVDHSLPLAACIGRYTIYRQLIPIFLHIVGIAYVSPREIVDHWYIKPHTMHRFILWMDGTSDEDPQRFREFFCISPDLFFYLCELLHLDMITDPLESLQNRKLIVMRQVAQIALRRSAAGDTFLTLGKIFGVFKSTASKVTWKFICALRSRVGQVICWPDAAGLAKVKSAFEDQSGLPNSCGALNGMHIRIGLPAGEDSTQYYDWKHKLSVSMQAICDHQMHFMDVFCGLPGSIQDTRLLRLSRFYTQVT